MRLTGSYVTKSFLQKKYPFIGDSIGISDVYIEKANDKLVLKKIDDLRLKDNRDVFIIGSLGTVNAKYKGHHIVIKVLSRLIRNGISNFQYVIAGGGDNKRLCKLVQKLGLANYVHFSGTIAFEDVPSWLDKLDIYCQPSLSEGLPRSVIEAMSRGLPVISSDAGGMPELIESEMLVSKNNIYNDLYKKLANLTVDILVKHSIINLNRSNEYLSTVLDDKRNAFLDTFFFKKT